MNDVAIRLTNVSKKYQLYKRKIADRFKDIFLPGSRKRFKQFEALKDVSLEVKKGEILGIIGRNGAGKSTLLRIISGISQATSGLVETNGRIMPLLGLGGGFNPEYTGKENIYFYCSLLGMRREEINAVYDEIVAFSELGDFIDVPVKSYSSGMKSRLGFAVSINIDPDILILDEVLSVGDELFRRKCYVRMEELFNKGKTVLYVTHSVGSIIEICTRALLIHEGQLLLDDIPRRVVSRYRKLLSTIGKERDRVVREIVNLNENHDKKTLPIPEAQIPFQNYEIKGMPFFQDNLVTKSAELFQEKAIMITKHELLTLEGEVVNNILSGDEYNVKFMVVFDEPAQDVSFGAVVYNKFSKNISGAFFPKTTNSLNNVLSGSKFNLTFTMKMDLVPGIYFIRLIVQGQKNGQIIHLAHYKDALVFRVLENKSEIHHITEATLFQNASILEVKNK